MEQLLVGYFLNSVWQLLLLAAGAWLLVRALRPSPRAQHRIWTALLPLALVLPLLSLHSGPQPRVAQAAALPKTPSTTELPVATHSLVIPFPAQESRVPHSSRSHRDEWGPQALDQPAIQTPAIAPIAVPPTGLLHWPSTRELRFGPSATRWIAAFYLATIAFALFRLLFGLGTAGCVLARAEPAVLNPSQSRLLDQCCERLNVPRPAVLESAAAHSPMVVGVARPALLLPRGYASHPPNSAHELEAVWLHELAHLRRGDSLANLICRLLALPMAYHPATWAVEQRIRQTREMLCDAIAAAEMQSPTGYARCLVALARTLQLPGTMTAQFDGAAMFDGTSLEERVMQLIEAKRTVTLRTRALRLACAASVILAVIAAAATFHVTPTLAESPKPSSEAALPAQAPEPAAAPAPAAAAESYIAGARDESTQLDEARRQFDTGMRIAREAVARAARQGIRGEDPDAERADLRRQIEDSQLQSEAARKEWNDALRQSINAQVRASTEARIHANEADINSAELKKEIAQAEAQANNPEVRKQIDEAMARVNSPEFKKQMDEANAKFNSPEFKEQMDEAKAKFNSPEFKKKIEYLNSPEFKNKLDLQKQIYLNQSFPNLPQFREQMEKLQATLDSPEFRESLQKLNSSDLTRQLNDLHKELDQLREQLLKNAGEHANPMPAPAP